jgi:ATP-dependent Clp protease adaptor protein ClpS
MGDEVVVLDRDEEETGSREPGRFAVVLLNDDFTPTDWVADLLVRAFGKDPWEALDLTYQVHYDGSAVAGIYPPGPGGDQGGPGP